MHWKEAATKSSVPRWSTWSKPWRWSQPLMVIHLVKTLFPLVIAALVRPHIPGCWCQHRSPWAQPSPGVTSEIAQGSLGSLFLSCAEWRQHLAHPEISTPSKLSWLQAARPSFQFLLSAKCLPRLYCLSFAHSICLKTPGEWSTEMTFCLHLPCTGSYVIVRQGIWCLGATSVGPRRCCDWHLKKNRRDRIKSSK